MSILFSFFMQQPLFFIFIDCFMTTLIFCLFVYFYLIFFYVLIIQVYNRFHYSVVIYEDLNFIPYCMSCVQSLNSTVFFFNIHL